MFNQFMKNITFLLVLFLFSCNNIDNNYKEARFSDFYNSNSNKLLIDVRTPEEFIEKRALESININFYDENFNDDILKISKEKKLISVPRNIPEKIIEVPSIAIILNILFLE